MSSRADLINDIVTKINDNTTGDITALDIREVVTSIVNSSLNRTDDRRWGRYYQANLQGGGTGLSAVYLGQGFTRITHNFGTLDYAAICGVSGGVRLSTAAITDKTINTVTVATSDTDKTGLVDYSFEIFLEKF